ncbi:MAG: ATP-binding cassette domain-containing protein, partial [Eubacteriales bacterium]|nr:ATP-binding cassette domain-containing protein [Eubacteriales bacterium]
MTDNLIRMIGISKEFPGVKALNKASFELDAGEVHALVGENGAGKSTLMKVLTGVYTKDEGEIFYKGRPV